MVKSSGDILSSQQPSMMKLHLDASGGIGIGACQSRHRIAQDQLGLTSDLGISGVVESLENAGAFAMAVLQREDYVGRNLSGIAVTQDRGATDEL